MLYRRVMILGVLCVLFVASTGLGQIEPSQSEILNAVHKVDKEVAVLSEKITGIEGRLDQKIDLSIKGVEDRLGERLNGTDKEIKGIKDRIKDLQGTLNWILRGIVVILLYIVGHLTKPLWDRKLRWRSKINADSVDEKLGEAIKDEEKISSDDFLDNTQPDYQPEPVRSKS